MQETFRRVRDFYGEDGFAAIRKSAVLVAGLGGVGSHCALALARSGIGKLYLVDFDCITASSLNRNPLAGRVDMGRNKAEFFTEALGDLCPETECVPMNVFIHRDYLEKNPLPGDTDVVADAIDSLNPKTHLLEYCSVNRIPVFSSMGAAGRRDVPSIRTGDISLSGGCPLARMVRKYMRRRGISGGITCVWSTEPPVKPLPPDDEPRLEIRGRVRNSLPSLITLPGVFGYTLTQLILDSITGS